MDWLNRARQLLGNLFGGAQRTIGQISGNVARGVGRAEQQAARVAQQVVRQIPQPPRIQLPQIPQVQMPRFQAPRVQLPQAPKIDLAAVTRVLGQQAAGFGEGMNIGFKQVTGQQLSPREQQVIDFAKRTVPTARPFVQATENISKFTRETTERNKQLQLQKLQQLKESPATAIAQNLLGPLNILSKAGEASKVFLGKDIVPKIDTTKAVDDLTKSLANSPLKNVPGIGVVSDIVNPIAKQIARGTDVLQNQEQYSKGLKGMGEFGSDLATVISLFYAGGLSKQLATRGTAFLPTAARLAPRLAASGAGQNILQQISEGKKLKEIDPKQVAAAAALYTGLGVGIPGVTRGVSAGLGKALGKGQAGLTAQAVRALPTDKNALVIARSIPEKGALRAQGYTNVKVDYKPKPGQVAPTMQGAIYETAPKPSKLPISKQRGFTESVRTSPEVSQDVASAVSGEYTPKANQILIDKAAKFSNNLGKATENIKSELDSIPKNSLISDQTVANAMLTAKKHDALGNFQQATEIYDKLSQKLTEAGRTVQAASLLQRQSPEGLLYGARKLFKKAGVEITPKIEKELQAGIEAVKAAPMGSEARSFAIAKMQKDMMKHIPNKTIDNLISVWKGGLLSGFKTQAGNLLSNTSFGVLKLTSNPISALADSLLSVFTKKRSYTLTGKGLATGGLEGAKKGVITMRTGIDMRDITGHGAKFEVPREINFKSKTLQTVLGNPTNLVFRGMSAADQPVYFAALKNSLYNQAKAEGLNQGLKGQALKDFIKKNVFEPTNNMAELAVKDAEKAVLSQDNALSSIINYVNRPEINPGLRLIVNSVLPFTKVPANFILRTIDYSPLGLVKGGAVAIKQIYQHKFDQRALAQAIGEGLTGTGVIAIGTALASQGLLSGDYPKNDQKEQARWKAEGITPNSVKLGDKWISLNYLGPIGLLFGMGKNISDARNNNASLIEQFSQAVGGFTSGLLQQSFLQGLSSFVSAANDPGRYWPNYLKNQIGSVVPAWINDLANISDNMQRQANTTIEQVMARVPGLRQALPVKVDVFGRQLKQPSGTGLETALNPLKPSLETKTSLTNELDRLKNINKEYNVWPTPIDQKDFFGKGTNITKQQMQQIQSELGPQLEQRWNQIIQSPEYQRANDQQKANMLSKAKQDVTLQYKIASAANYGQQYVGPAPKVAKVKKVRISKARRTGGRGRVARAKVTIPKAPRLKAIKVAVPKAPKVSFKQPTPTKARKSIKIKTG